jgi:hypothetical protein
MNASKMKCYEKGVVVISSDGEGSDRLDTIRSRIGNQFFAHELEDLRECLGGSQHGGSNLSSQGWALHRALTAL